MSINMDNPFDSTKVVELDALKTVSVENTLFQSTAFEASEVLREWPEPVLTEKLSESEESSETSISTASGSDMEEHRHLSQSLKISSLHDGYSSFRCDSTCNSDVELSGSTLEGISFDESSLATDTEGSSWREDYSDDDGHYKLIQLPLSGSAENLEFWQPLSAESDDDESSFDELETSLRRVCKQLSSQEEGVKESEEEQEFCVQCHAWPEVEDCRDPPRRFFDVCHHTRIDPMECAFGTNVHLSTVSLSFVEENLVAAGKRKVVEHVLRTEFNTLIQQFSVNPEKVARILYGVSVIDIVDLGIATAPALPELERATVLLVTLVRRLRRWPDLFGDVCKVLSDIPAMQEANAKVRRLLYEGFTEDQYSEILARSVPERHQFSIGDRQHSNSYSGPDSSAANPDSNPDSIGVDPDSSAANPSSNSVANTGSSDANPDTSSESSSTHLGTSYHRHDSSSDEKSSGHNIIAEDSVSFASTMSEGAADSEAQNQRSDCACPRVNQGANLRLHQSCLENRSIRSLDALMAEKQVDIDARDKNGRSPLLVACLCLPTEEKNLRISLKQAKKIKNLLENGADSSIQDYDGNTALHIATLRRDVEVVKLLLDRSYIKEFFRVAVTNKNSRTALHYACYWGDVELVTPLLEFEKEAKSGLVGVRDRNGETGLHIASRGGYKAIVKELLKAKAEKDVKNREGKTPADVAEETKHNSIAKLLRRKKSRWLFPRKKVVSADQPDCGVRRSPSNLSLQSQGSNQSDEMFHWSGEESEEEDSNHEDQEM